MDYIEKINKINDIIKNNTNITANYKENINYVKIIKYLSEFYKILNWINDEEKKQKSIIQDKIEKLYLQINIKKNQQIKYKKNLNIYKKCINDIYLYLKNINNYDNYNNSIVSCDSLFVNKYYNNNFLSSNKFIIKNINNLLYLYFKDNPEIILNLCIIEKCISIDKILNFKNIIKKKEYEINSSLIQKNKSIKKDITKCKQTFSINKDKIEHKINHLNLLRKNIQKQKPNIIIEIQTKNNLKLLKTDNLDILKIINEIHKLKIHSEKKFVEIEKLEIQLKQNYLNLNNQYSISKNNLYNSCIPSISINKYKKINFICNDYNKLNIFLININKKFINDLDYNYKYYYDLDIENGTVYSQYEIEYQNLKENYKKFNSNINYKSNFNNLLKYYYKELKDNANLIEKYYKLLNIDSL